MYVSWQHQVWHHIVAHNIIHVLVNKWYTGLLYEQKCLETTALFTVKVMGCLFNRGFQKEADAVNNVLSKLN